MSWQGPCGRGVFFMSEDEEHARDLVEKAEPTSSSLRSDWNTGPFSIRFAFTFSKPQRS